MDGKLLSALVFPLVTQRDVAAQRKAGPVLGLGTPSHCGPRHMNSGIPKVKQTVGTFSVEHSLKQQFCKKIWKTLKALVSDTTAQEQLNYASGDVKSELN